MNDWVLGLGAGGWQVWSLHDSARSVSQEAYKWGKGTMMENKTGAALEMRGSSQPPGHNALICCSSSLSHLYTVIQWDHIHAPGLQILIAQALPRGRGIQRSYVHEAELVPRGARGRMGETTATPLCFLETSCWRMARRPYYSRRN